MPRTKLRKPASSLIDAQTDTYIKDYDVHSKLKLRQITSRFEMLVISMRNQVDSTISRMPAELRQITLGELLTVDFPNDDENLSTSDHNMSVDPPETVKSKRNLKRQTGISDDGYATEGARSTSHRQKHISKVDEKSVSVKEKSRKTRSSTRNQSRVQTSNSGVQRASSTSRANNKLFTPAVQKPQTEFNIVTPKVKPNTPWSMLRRPKDGEMVLSMQGSPVLVSAIVQERTANVNVPLNNGNIISLLPNDGLRMSLMPELDQHTLNQLKTLKGHIEKVLGRN